MAGTITTIGLRTVEELYAPVSGLPSGGPALALELIVRVEQGAQPPPPAPGAPVGGTLDVRM